MLHSLEKESGLSHVNDTYGVSQSCSGRGRGLLIPYSTRFSIQVSLVSSDAICHGERANIRHGSVWSRSAVVQHMQGSSLDLGRKLTLLRATHFANEVGLCVNSQDRRYQTTQLSFKIGRPGASIVWCSIGVTALPPSLLYWVRGRSS